MLRHNNPLLSNITGNNLTLAEQKELVDHIFDRSRKNAYRMMLVVFPVTLGMMAVILGTVFWLVGIWKI